MHRSNFLRGAVVAALLGAGLAGIDARADETAPAAAGSPGTAPATDAREAVAEAQRVRAPIPDELKMPDVAPVGIGDIMLPFVKTMVGLIIVLGLIYLTLHKGLGTLVAKSQMGKRMRLVERVSLDQRRAIYLVEIDGKEMVLAGGEGGVVKIVETAKREAPAGEGAPSVSFANRFTAALSAKKPANGPPVTGLPRAIATSGETQEG